MYIAGIDGCKKGWSVAVQIQEELTIEYHTSIAAMYAKHPNLEIMAIDMIIGLPKYSRKGGRSVEKEARKLLSPRGSVVFSAPCRAAVYAKNYEEALKTTRALSPDGVGLSKQSYNITPKIRELDQFLRGNPSLKTIIFETHPELGFWEMNGRNPLSSKHKAHGIEQRKQLLLAQGLRLDEAQSIDDLDALACLWTAARQHHKQAHNFFPAPPLDEFGLPMQITW